MTRYPAPIGLLLLLCSGCFFKSDKTGAADDIIREFLYTDSAGQVLIAQEKVFHATSKSAGGGITHISGHANTRLSAYDVKNGELLARTVLGGETEEASQVLALTGNRLWCLSKKNGITLETYDPRTLQVTATTGQLLRQAPGLQQHLANPEWYQLRRFYGYDPLRGIILSDDQGFRYRLHPATLQVQKLDSAGYQLPALNTPDISTYRVAFNDTIVLHLQGATRKNIRIEQGRRPLENDPGFLQGSFLADHNPERIMALQAVQRQSLRAQISRQQRIKDSLLQLANALPERSVQHRVLSSHARTAQYRVTDLERKAARLVPYHLPGATDRPLQVAPCTFFILHASSTNKDATLVVSSLEWAPGQPLRQRWQTTLPDLFFDPANARETSAFKTVFSSGNPQFRFKWADIAGQQLLITWMLQTCCIDTENGKVLWRVKH